MTIGRRGRPPLSEDHKRKLKEGRDAAMQLRSKLGIATAQTMVAVSPSMPVSSGHIDDLLRAVLAELKAIRVLLEHPAGSAHRVDIVVAQPPQPRAPEPPANVGDMISGIPSNQS